LNRFNVSLFAIQAPEGAGYFPHIMEILITTGLFSAGVLVYYLVAKNFPVFVAETHAVK
jgi:Ni/Fe-hydrogenase subunit HybB-like protein